MKQEYYRPIIKKGDHLVRSSKDPNKVRGLSRDKNNKNQGIPEWEKVTVNTSSKQDIEAKKIDLKIAKQNKAEAVLTTITSIIQFGNQAVVFLEENPEVAESIKNATELVIRGTKSILQKATVKVKTMLPKSKQNCDENYIKEVKFKQSGQEVMTVDEIRQVFLQTMFCYIQIKNNMDILLNARIENMCVPQISEEQMFEYMDQLIIAYPKLIDENTKTSVNSILKLNWDMNENNKIRQILKIAA